MYNNKIYRKKLAEEGLLKGAEKWLKRNPPPKDWKFGRYAWAYTEMPVLFGFVLWWL